MTTKKILYDIVCVCAYAHIYIYDIHSYRKTYVRLSNIETSLVLARRHSELEEDLARRSETQERQSQEKLLEIRLEKEEPGQKHHGVETLYSRKLHEVFWSFESWMPYALFMVENAIVRYW